MAEPYPYLGTQETWYQAYLDDDTGEMLIAVPGESYSMSPVASGLPVPPNDGRWETPAEPAPETEPVWSAPAQPAPEQDNPEGGE